MTSKKLRRSFLVALGGLSLTACQVEQPRQTDTYETSTQTVQDTSPMLKTELCLADVRLKQSRVSLDIGAHIKDSMNASDFKLPMSCADVASMAKGDDIFKDFRGGSLLVDGTISSWNLTYQGNFNKAAEYSDEKSCSVKFDLYQDRVSLNPFQHMKDSMNKTEFSLDMPCAFTDNLKIGDNLIDKNFRVGSLIFRGSVGKWKLDVASKTPVL